MGRFRWVLVLVFLCYGHVDGASVLAVDHGDIFVDMGRRDGIQIGTIFNVYRNKEVEADFGNMKFTTRIFIGRVYAYKVGDTQTVTRVKELPSVANANEDKAVLKNDIAQAAFVIPADELFQPGKDDLLADAIPKLDQLVRFLKRFQALKIRIEVHADERVGNATKVTKTQANRLQSWLVNDRGFKSSMFVPVGYGSQKPIASNAAAAGRRTNRRIEIVVED